MTDSPRSKRYFGRWFRFYASAIDDPKIQTLPDPLFRTWINLLCLASKADGVIPGGKQLSFGLRLSDALTKKRLDALVALGLIDRTELGFSPHNWGERQFQSDSSAARMRALRSRKNGSSDSQGDGQCDVTCDGGDDRCDGGGGVTGDADVTLSPSVYLLSVTSEVSNQVRELSGKVRLEAANDETHLANGCVQ
jgi:hypothetical protein